MWGYKCKTCLGVTWENMDGANGQTARKNRSSTFVLTAFISFGQFHIHPTYCMGKPLWSGFYPVEETYFKLNYETCSLTNSHYMGNGHWVHSWLIVSCQNKYVQNVVIIEIYIFATLGLAKHIFSEFDNDQFKQYYINYLHWTNCLWLYENHLEPNTNNINISGSLKYHHMKLLHNQVHSIICPWVSFLASIKLGRWYGLPTHDAYYSRCEPRLDQTP